jgi:nitrate reductase NapE component
LTSFCFALNFWRNEAHPNRQGHKSKEDFERVCLRSEMKPVTRTRLLLLAIMIFPIVAMALFWLFGKDPEDPAATLPVMPPR